MPRPTAACKESFPQERASWCANCLKKKRCAYGKAPVPCYICHKRSAGASGEIVHPLDLWESNQKGLAHRVCAQGTSTLVPLTEAPKASCLWVEPPPPKASTSSFTAWLQVVKRKWALKSRAAKNKVTRAGREVTARSRYTPDEALRPRDRVSQAITSKDLESLTAAVDELGHQIVSEAQETIDLTDAENVCLAEEAERK